jgi:hypothetical protein
MRFMMMVKHAENQGPPPKELMDAMAKITEEAVQAGTLLGSGGLAPLAQSTRVRVSEGQLTVTDGPFTEAKEVVGGFAQFELKSRQEAIEGAVHFMELHRKHWPGWEGETEIRQIFGPEEFAHASRSGRGQRTGRSAIRGPVPKFRADDERFERDEPGLRFSLSCSTRARFPPSGALSRLPGCGVRHRSRSRGRGRRCHGIRASRECGGRLEGARQ